MPDAVIEERVVAALAAAIEEDAALTLRLQPDLGGGTIVGPTVDAYVIPVAGGFRIDLWRPEGRNEFSAQTVADLAEAVRIAVAAARPRPRRSRDVEGRR